MKIKMLCMSLLASAALAAAEGPNLLKNPDFKDKDSYRKEWVWGSMGDEIFDVRYDKEKEAVSIASSSNEFSGFDIENYSMNFTSPTDIFCNGSVLLCADGTLGSTARCN